MRRDDNHFDKLLRSRLENYSADPPGHVWQGISTGIQKSGKHGRANTLWWLSVAALLFLAIISGIFIYQGKDDLHPVGAEGPDSQGGTALVTPPDTGSPEISASVFFPELPSPDEGIAGIRDSRTGMKTAGTGLVSGTQPERKAEVIVAIRPIRKYISADLSSDELYGMPEQMIITADNLSVADKKIVSANIANYAIRRVADETSWKLGVHLSPGFSSHTASHSRLYASNMTYADNKPEAGMGGGVSVQYKTSSRWRVESGMYYSKSGGNSGNVSQYTTTRADFASAPLSAEKYFNTGVNLDEGQISMNSTAGVIRFSHTPADAELVSIPDNFSGNTAAMLTPGEFSQIFDFVEIPIFARYQVLDTRLGVELVGGVSTNIMVANNVFMESFAGRELVGTTRDISTINFSGTAGVGFIYSLGKNVSLSVEPRFNYYLNSINHSGDVEFRPWRAGIFTGLSYEF
jgi:hypothetical protein